ncbi:MAG: transporter substrate-binding domain-containing protein [Erysipelotrichaceae bacterium]|nr:transporter substrate-binding domain-containing protein [Erysipelotrichaceae bacterium]
MFKKFVKTVLAGSLAVGLAACGSSTSGDGDVYEIGCDAKYAPFSMEIDGTYVGIDVEILDAVAEAEGFEYNLTPMDFSGIIPGLSSGQLDGAIAGISVTEERKATVDFSDGYYDSALALIVKNDNSAITSLDDLDGTSAAVKKGTRGATFAEEFADTYGFSITYYDDSPSMFLAVQNGNNDFLLEDYPVISYQINEGIQTGLKVAVETVGDGVPYAFAVKKGENQDLLNMFNDGLATIKENGTYDEILSKYI